MPHDPQAGGDPRPASAPGPELRPAKHGHDAGSLGQAIANRLFAAGTDLQFALMVAGDGAAGSRLWHAVGELDEAIRELRFLMLAIPDQTAAASPGGDSGSAGQ
jgi:hypothetical protein